jgi:hypothetical protein
MRPTQLSITSGVPKERPGVVRDAAHVSVNGYQAPNGIGNTANERCERQQRKKSSLHIREVPSHRPMRNQYSVSML